MGPWYATVNSIGPYGPAGDPVPTVDNVYAYLYVRPEDFAVYPVNGNPCDDINCNTNYYSPLILAPGASGNLPVYIYPDSTLVGQTVTGFLYVDTLATKPNTRAPANQPALRL